MTAPTNPHGNSHGNSQDNSQGIRTATVVGAGTMGAAIAGHLANAGLSVYLLDIVPTTLTPEEQTAGLTLDDAPVRNRIVTAGFERMQAARPANLFAPHIADEITLGNLEDDLAHAAGASDWIIEAIVEKPGPKQQLMARLQELAPPHTVISTNTSGIPIEDIIQGRSQDFARRFLGTHFFNPPRYLHLLEIIPSQHTDPAVVARMAAFAERAIGKGVVICKDTPNFIANRMISYILADIIEFAIDQGYRIEEVDFLAGPLIGRARSGVFRLLDIIGIDVMALINRNLHPLIPDDTDRDILQAPLNTSVMQTLIDQGHLGAKTGQGFYKTVTDAQGNRTFWGLDLAAAARGEVTYLPPRSLDFPRQEAARRAPLPERLRSFMADDDRGAALIRHTLLHTLGYAAHRVPEIADSIVDIDNVMRWGFLWELGPFELWDALGFEPVAQQITEAGLDLPDWIVRMQQLGHTAFYRNANGTRTVYDPRQEAYVAESSRTRAAQAATSGKMTTRAQPVNLPDLRRHSTPVYTNDSATLHPIGDGFLLLEFHSKLNALDSGSLDALQAAHDALTGNAAGLLIGNDGSHFSVGANLQQMLAAAQAARWTELDAFIQRGQYLLLALRRAARPVVAAPFQRVLGGGVEVCLAAHRVIAHAETYMGLVETGVGLIPGWGGCKEMVRRHVHPYPDAPGNATARNDTASLPPGLQSIFELIAFSKVSTSAVDAQRLGLLAPADPIVMHPGQLLQDAYDRLQQLAQAHPAPQPAAQLVAAGKLGQTNLHQQIEAFWQQGKFSEYDAQIARRLAHVLCGGDAGAPSLQSEEHFLELERAAFLSLAGEPKTQARMAHMLKTGKPLRN